MLYQTQHVQHINVATLNVPPRLPNAESNFNTWLDLYKTVHAGDVVFSLRCPASMINNQFASKMTRKSQYNYAYNINLATVNYILFRLQTFFYAYAEACCSYASIADYNGAGNADDQRTSFRQALNAQYNIVRTNCENRHKMWQHWFDFIADTPTANVDKGILSMIKWATVDPADTSSKFPCFFEKWWYDILEPVVANYDGATLTAPMAEKMQDRLREAFTTRVEDFLWGWIMANTKIMGIYIGSDEAGGAHQESKNSNATWPNDYAGVVQATGKNRRTSNIWNRRGDASDRDGFSSGDPLGFVLERHTIFDRPFTLQKLTRTTFEENVDGKQIDNVRFSLSSNPNTALNVQPMSLDVFFPYIGHYSVLTPSSNVKEAHSSETCMKTFLQFACANQMCRSMNTNQSRIQLAHEALQCGGCPPIEIIMRRKFYDQRCHEVGKTTESVRMWRRKIYGVKQSANVGKARYWVQTNLAQRYKDLGFDTIDGLLEPIIKAAQNAAGAATWANKSGFSDIAKQAGDLEAARMLARKRFSTAKDGELLQIVNAAAAAAAAEIKKKSTPKKIQQSANAAAEAEAAKLKIGSSVANPIPTVTAVGDTAADTGVGQPMDVDPPVEAVQETAATKKSKKKVMLE